MRWMGCGEGQAGGGAGAGSCARRWQAAFNTSAGAAITGTDYCLVQFCILKPQATRSGSIQILRLDVGQAGSGRSQAHAYGQPDQLASPTGR